MKLSQESRVGILVAVTAVLTIVLAWLVGFQNPFRKAHHYFVTYEFAGGIEVGSPVRVSGIKVGRVEAIEFFTPAPAPSKTPLSQKEPGSAESSENQELIPVQLEISVDQKAARGLRLDSRFYINLAGIIGERYIEITPGSKDAPALKPGQTVAGVDPPRIDQLISQSFNLAGKIIDILEKNEGDISKSIENLYKLSANFNKMITNVEKSKLFNTNLSELIGNLTEMSHHLKTLTQKIETPEGKKTLELLHDLLWRLEPLNQDSIQKFFQKEGIRTRIF